MRDPFYVRWIECWGGGRIWGVFKDGARVAKVLKTEAAARKLCERMNTEWARYQMAIWDKPRTERTCASSS